jgi:hypothetical protein
MTPACPCCGQRLLEPPEQGSVDLSDARPGDGWCEPCHWVLLREVREGQFKARCPTHQGRNGRGGRGLAHAS